MQVPRRALRDRVRVRLRVRVRVRLRVRVRVRVRVRLRLELGLGFGRVARTSESCFVLAISVSICSRAIAYNVTG